MLPQCREAVGELLQVLRELPHGRSTGGSLVGFSPTNLQTYGFIHGKPDFLDMLSAPS